MPMSQIIQGVMVPDPYPLHVPLPFQGFPAGIARSGPPAAHMPALASYHTGASRTSGTLFGVPLFTNGSFFCMLDPIDPHLHEEEKNA